jgi:serine/threonine protein kinase
VAKTSESGHDRAAGAVSRGKPFARGPRFKRLGQGPIASSRKADVWKVRDLGANPYVGGDRVVAVKVLKPEVELGDRERLRREGDESRRIDHSNLVRILDCRGGPRSPYLVMEYIEGENLTKLLDGRRRPIAAERLAELAIQLCAALECLHRRRLIHRDVKPGNLVIKGTLDGEGPVMLKLVDLGIAIEFDKADGEKAGSEPYMSPEVQFDRQASRRSDVYGAGMVLYEMATGRRLESVSDQEYAAGHRFGSLAPPHVVNGAVPVWLSALIMRAIEVSPGGRFAGAEAMREALESGGVAEEEAPTMAIGDDDTITRVMPREGSRPLVFTLLDSLPSWLRQKLPPDFEDDPSVHWYLFLLALGAGVILITALCLPIEAQVVMTLYGLPHWLLTAGVLVFGVAVWYQREAYRREAFVRGARLTQEKFGRALAGAGGVGLWFLRGAGHVAAAIGRQVVSLLRPELAPAPVGPDLDSLPDPEIAHVARPRVLRRPGAETRRPGHGERYRPRGTVLGSPLRPFLTKVRAELKDAGDAARAWTPWLGRRLYLVLLIALCLCVGIGLYPPLHSRVAQQPADHRTVLIAIPAAIWILVALLGLWRSRTSRARWRKLVLGGLALLAVLVALGMAMPWFSGWLETRLWPPHQAHTEAATGTAAASTDSPLAHHARPAPAPSPSRREVARSRSHGLVLDVRGVEREWVHLLHHLAGAGWTIDPETAETVRTSADSLVSGLNGWRRLAQYETAREKARHWAKSMRHGSAQLADGSCAKFEVGSRGALAQC